MADQPALTKEQEAMGMTQPVAQVDVQNQPTVTFVVRKHKSKPYFVNYCAVSVFL